MSPMSSKPSTSIAGIIGLTSAVLLGTLAVCEFMLQKKPPSQPTSAPSDALHPDDE